MTTRSLARLRDDDGATTVVFAVVVLVLFGVAALGVELTNLYTRDRAVQTTADVAAFAGAQGLPDTCEAFAQALRTLNAQGNAVQDDSPDGERGVPAVATAAAMSDGGLGNGEIELLRRFEPGVAIRDDDRLPTSSCSGSVSAVDPQVGPGRVVVVTTPGRTVAFAFAGVFSAFPGREAVTSAEVRARATVGLVGPEGASVLPVFLPGGCVGRDGGPVYLSLPPPEPEVPGSPVLSPPGDSDGPVVTGVRPQDVVAGSTAQLRVRLAGLLSDPVSVPPVFDLHRVTAGTTTRLLVEPDEARLVGVPVSQTGDDGVLRWAARYAVVVGPDVTGTSARWIVRAAQPSLAEAAPAGADLWSPDGGVGSFLVTAAPPRAGACPGSTAGDLGLLDPLSPTARSSALPDAAAFDGLRPAVASFALVERPTRDTRCTSDGTPVGAVLQDDPAQDGATCLRVLGLPADDASELVTAGLLTGGDDRDGRLTAPAPIPSCLPPSGRDDLQWTTPQGDTVVNTALSCYLAPTADGGAHTLEQVMAGVPGALRGEIFSDPRFAFVPVLGTTDRPSDGFWPVEQLRGSFVTDERPGSPATCASGTDCNGLVLDGTGRLREVALLTFPSTALPESVDQPGNGTPWSAGSKDFLLRE